MYFALKKKQLLLLTYCTISLIILQSSYNTTAVVSENEIPNLFIVHSLPSKQSGTEVC